MSLWQHPKAMAALCTAAVLLCAAAPALFLTAVDMSSIGRSEAVQGAYTAPVPSGEDYYILRQLKARDQQQQSTASVERLPEQPEQPEPDLKLYIGAQSGLESMSNGYEYRETVDTALQNLASQGVLDPAWVAWATDWEEGDGSWWYEGYNGGYYDLTIPYCATDSLGFVTIKRFGLEQGALYTAFSLTMDTRTGVVTQLWISAPREGDTAPAAPDENGLRAFASQAGLEALGDWAVPENSPYGCALYSRNGEALISAAVNAYDYTAWTENVTVTQPRWFLSLSLQPCTEAELPVLLP